MNNNKIKLKLTEDEETEREFMVEHVVYLWNKYLKRFYGIDYEKKYTCYHNTVTNTSFVKLERGVVINDRQILILINMLRKMYVKHSSIKFYADDDGRLCIEVSYL